VRKSRKLQVAEHAKKMRESIGEFEVRYDDMTKGGTNKPAQQKWVKEYKGLIIEHLAAKHKWVQ
jgi:hypothetical protein